MSDEGRQQVNTILAHLRPDVASRLGIPGIDGTTAAKREISYAAARLREIAPDYTRRLAGAFRDLADLVEHGEG